MKLKSFINILFFGFQIYIKQNCYNYQKNVLQMRKEWHYYSIFICMARQKNAISSVQLTVSVTDDRNRNVRQECCRDREPFTYRFDQGIHREGIYFSGLKVRGSKVPRNT